MSPTLRIIIHGYRQATALPRKTAPEARTTNFCLLIADPEISSSASHFARQDDCSSELPQHRGHPHL